MNCLDFRRLTAFVHFKEKKTGVLYQHNIFITKEVLIL